MDNPEVLEPELEPVAEAELEPELEEDPEELEEVPQEIKIEEPQELQNSPTGDSNSQDPMLFIQLGDRVVIDSKYGRVVGTVYYRSLERISIKPDGVSNKLYDFELEQTDEEELYKEEYGVTSAYVIEKRMFESFVEQQDFRVNQVIDTFDKNGEIYKTYKIVSVDKENDSIQIEGEDIQDLKFNFTGIESDEDFKIISIQQFVEEKEEKVEDEVEEKDEEDEEDEVKIIGIIDIVRPKIYKEAAYFEQKIPDSIQKIDALNDFLNNLSALQQKDQKVVRSKRIEVETYFNLKQSTIEYNEDGTLKGQKQISVKMLSELIKKASIPLGRPVLAIKKKLYDVSEVELDDIYFEDFNIELDSIVQNKSGLVSSAGLVSGGKMIREWNDQQSFFKKYAAWTSEKSEPLWNAITDTDFFRTNPPGQPVNGFIPAENKPVLDKIPFGLERALSTTYRKADRRKHILFPQDSATMNSYLLFPIKMARYLGSTRSSNLAIDSCRSQMKKDTMKGILEQTGEPVETGTSNNLILLDVTGNTIGNIPLADYIDGMSVPSLGLGDTFVTLDQYGMHELELTPQIVEVLVKKIDLYQKQLINTLAIMRDNINKEATEIDQNPFLVTDIFESMKSQFILKDDLIDYERINPSLSGSDIGKIAYLMKKHPNYFQAFIGKNAMLISNESIEANNLNQIEFLKNTNIIKYNEQNKGEAPTPNTCKHIRDLVAVRRLDEEERFRKFIDFFRKYQGGRDMNWINCNVCKEHLICIHERLQMQAYLNPNEKDSIQKEIILKFAGGQFQGKYICRNCGQAIRDIDFDNNIEFDDEGKPKSGNAIIDDDFEEKMTQMVQMDTMTEGEQKCYNIICEIAQRVGIALDKAGLNNIIAKSVSWIKKYPTMQDYNESKKKNPAMPDYDVAISRIIITACATFLHLEIQTKIPPYIVKPTNIGCPTGFGGYPLDPDIKKQQGIEYIACAVGTIRRNEPPWDQTGFQKMDVARRQQGIAKFINNILKEIISDNIIQSDLSEKRKYKEIKIEVKDEIYATFLPEQLIITPEEAAKDAIIPEVVGDATLWIRSAHVMAKKSALLIHGSPFIEATCCLHNIENPDIFWKELPELAKRSLVPKKQGQFLMTQFNPRPGVSDVVEPDKELYYRIFLKCCFQGPRIGHPHEPGLLYSCQWCGFQFPTLPSVMDTDTEGKSALLSQNVNTGATEFVNLLDIIHTVNRVEPIKQIKISSVSEIMDEFSDIHPTPIPNWKEIIRETTANFLSLPPDVDKGDIAMAAATISDATKLSADIIKSRISPKFQSVLEYIVKLSWINFFQVIQSYFITPFQRILSQFSPGSLEIPIELTKDLSETHVKDITPILANDNLILTLKGETIKDPKFNLARSKLRYYLKQMSAVLEYKNKIRPNVVPGRDITFTYIQRAIMYGPFATLINPSEIPEDTEFKTPIESVGNTSMKYISEIVMLVLNKLNEEKLTFNDEEIKEMIAIRDEKERTHIIAEYSKLTDEERAIELMNQRLGLGKYAVGGTKLIYAYDKDYYDLERQKRFAAGIVEIPGSAGEYEEEGYDHNQEVDE